LFSKRFKRETVEPKSTIQDEYVMVALARIWRLLSNDRKSFEPDIYWTLLHYLNKVLNEPGILQSPMEQLSLNTKMQTEKRYAHHL